MYFVWFVVFFFFILTILNIKTCSFHFHFPSVFMPAKKKIPPFLSVSLLKVLLFDSFKNTSVCTNSYEKNITVLRGKKTEKKTYELCHKKNINMPDWTLMCFVTISEYFFLPFSSPGGFVCRTPWTNFSWQGATNTDPHTKYNFPQEWHPVVHCYFLYPLCAAFLRLLKK